MAFLFILILTQGLFGTPQLFSMSKSVSEISSATNAFLVCPPRKRNEPIRPRSENMQSVPRVEANSTLALILLRIGREKSMMAVIG